jgi:hypothetical protein
MPRPVGTAAAADASAAAVESLSILGGGLVNAAGVVVLRGA